MKITVHHPAPEVPPIRVVLDMSLSEYLFVRAAVAYCPLNNLECRGVDTICAIPVLCEMDNVTPSRKG